MLPLTMSSIKNKETQISNLSKYIKNLENVINEYKKHLDVLKENNKASKSIKIHQKVRLSKKNIKRNNLRSKIVKLNT